MEPDFVSFEEAQERILKEVSPLRKILTSLEDSLHTVVAEDIFAPIDLPPFTNSAMDGYAISLDGVSFPASFKVVGELRTGEGRGGRIKKGEAVKVFTGGPVPSGTDAVVEKEKVKVEGNFIWVEEKVPKGRNLRFQGEEVKKGEKVVEAGTVITPGVGGFLRGMGIREVKVFQKPRVSILVTGSELVLPGRRLKYGKIYETNSLSLTMALSTLPLDSVDLSFSTDQLGKVRNLFKKALKTSDLVLFTGGISEGEYDVVKKVLQEERVEKIFYKVRQKPGKPIFFGRKKGKWVFALPGNPVAVLVCFYEYVLPALKKMMGYRDIFLEEREAILLDPIQKGKGRVFFFRGKREKEGVRVLPHQESHMLSSFLGSDSLIVAGEDVERIFPGEKVKIHILR